MSVYVYIFVLIYIKIFVITLFLSHLCVKVLCLLNNQFKQYAGNTLTLTHISIYFYSGILNKECNKEGDILTVMNAFHQACFYEFARQIISNPLLHHAVHLASVRELCKKNTLNIYKNYKLNDFTLISLDKLYKTIKSPIQTSKISKNISKNMTAPKSSDKNNFVEENNDNFDNLEGIENNGEGVNNDDDKNDKKSFSRSIWSSLTGGDKSSKFKV
jgi:hypothetical protein